MELWTFSGSGSPFLAVSLSKTSIPLGWELSSHRLFSLPCIRTRELLQNFLMILGPGGFHRERIAMKQHIMITCWAKLRKVIIGVRINMKSAFKWASLIDLTLHLSQHNSNRRLVQILPPSAEQRGRSRRDERSRSRERTPPHSSSQDVDEDSATVDPQNRVSDRSMSPQEQEGSRRQDPQQQNGKKTVAEKQPGDPPKAKKHKSIDSDEDDEEPQNEPGTSSNSQPAVPALP